MSEENSEENIENNAMVEPLTGDDPRFIGPIPLVGRLGAGGMGRVYLGVHLACQSGWTVL